MLHKTIKAAATATDLGEFTAIAAAYTVDRANEQITQGAFAKTIERWQGSGKQIPLHWDHSASPQDIVGTVDPSQMREAEEGLYVKGQLDLEGSKVAREAWRLMKANSVALSFGYLVNEDHEEGGVKHLDALDLFEVTITPAPMNPDTRFLNLKSAKRELAKEFVAEFVAETEEMRGEVEKRSDLLQGALEGKETESLRKDSDNLAFNLATDGIADVERKAEAVPEPEPDPEPAPPEPEAPKPDETSQDVPDGDDQVPEEPAVEDARDEEPVQAKSPAQDPLRKAQDRLAYELAAGDIKRAEPPKVEEPTEDPSLEELRRESYRLMLETLIGE